MTSASGGPPSALEEYDKLVRNPSFLPSEAASASGLKAAFVLAARHVAAVPKAEVRCGQGGVTGRAREPGASSRRCNGDDTATPSTYMQTSRAAGAVARQAQPWRRLLDRRANDTTFGSDLGSGCRWLFAPDGP